jgi:hypothetical protein
MLCRASTKPNSCPAQPGSSDGNRPADLANHGLFPAPLPRLTRSGTPPGRGVGQQLIFLFPESLFELDLKRFFGAQACELLQSHHYSLCLYYQTYLMFLVLLVHSGRLESYCQWKPTFLIACLCQSNSHHALSPSTHTCRIPLCSRLRHRFRISVA